MGFIYKIEVGEECYIGSTKNKYLCNRQRQHNYDLKKSNSYLYEFCREHKIEKIICELLEEVDNENIRIKEQEYIELLNPSLNVKRAFQTKEERKEQIRLKDKKYREKNKDKINEKKKEYYENNKKICLEKMKENNKKKIKCDLCGSIVSKGSLKKHQSRMICRKIWDYSLLDSEDEE